MAGTIGFLLETITNEYSNKMLRGVLDGAEKTGMNLIRFSLDRTVFSIINTEAQMEIIYQTIGKCRLDGMIILGWWLTGEPVEQSAQLRRRFPGLKLLCMGKGLAGIPSVYMDGGPYMSALTTHLIEAHGYRNIVCIPPIIPDDRLSWYRKTMHQHNIKNPELEFTPGDIQKCRQIDIPRRVETILDLFLKQRKITVDAFISMFAVEAAELVRQLQNRGYNIPEDIAVTCFEEGVETQFCIPALTTVYYPFYEMGYESSLAMNRLIRGEELPRETVIRSRLIFRESCGCREKPDHSLARLLKEFDSAHLFTLPSPELEKLEQQLFLSLELPSVRKVWKLLIGGFKKENLFPFVRTCKRILLRPRVTDSQVQAFARDLSRLRDVILPFITENHKALSRFERAWADLQNWLRQRVHYLLGREQLVINERNMTFNKISQDLITTYNLPQLLDCFTASLKHLGIPGCFLFLYDNPEAMDARPVLAYREGRRIDLDSINPAAWRDKISTDRLAGGKRHVMLLNQLHVKNEQIGFVIFEPGPVDERLYYSLSIHLSTALKGTFLVENLQAANTELKATQKKIIDNAYQLGRANVALGTLHNAGNILNTLNFTLESLRTTIYNFPLKSLGKAIDLLAENQEDPAAFFHGSSKGRQFLPFLELLNTELLKQKEQMKTDINRAAQKNNLVTHLIHAGDANIPRAREPVPAADLVMEALAVMEVTLKKQGVQVLSKIETKAPICVDRIKLIHVLINLIRNAAEAMQANAADDKKLTVCTFQQEGIVTLQVTDNGAGIDPARLESLFRMGYSTKKPGRGYGLYTCSNYIKEMGGVINVANVRKGRGAVFGLQFKRE